MRSDWIYLDNDSHYLDTDRHYLDNDHHYLDIKSNVNAPFVFFVHFVFSIHFVIFFTLFILFTFGLASIQGHANCQFKAFNGWSGDPLRLISGDAFHLREVVAGCFTSK